MLSYNIPYLKSRTLFSEFAYKVIDITHKILYTWQVVGVGAGYIIKAFNSRLYRSIFAIDIIYGIL